jgi:hypothetical protein
VAATIAERVTELEAALAAERAALAAERERAAALAAERAALAAENERLRAAYRELQLEMELLRRRIFVAKAERIDTRQLELEFMAKLAELDRLGAELARSEEREAPEVAPTTPPAPAAPGTAPRRPRPTGRRDLSKADLPVERIEVPDPELEGKVERNGFEESHRVMWRRAGWVRLVLARVKYRTEPMSDPAPLSPTDPAPPTEATPALAPAASMPATEATAPASAAGTASTTASTARIVTARMPPHLLPRSIATPSLLAHILVEKFCDGLPFYRQEDRYARLGFRIDRGTMCRWTEDIGMTLGATIVRAARDEALATAFCLATDATGILIQPPRGEQVRRPCRRGHFFVQIADRDHVFFEYVQRETSAAVAELFRGFSGYVLADAKSVYDLLYRPPEARPPPDDGAEPDLGVRHEVGCWSHQRRKFWEAAIAKDPVAREGLARIMRMFQLERGWQKKSPAERKALRDVYLRPHVDAFFVWAEVEYERVKSRRGMLRSALGYAVRQKRALTRFLEDGRLPMTNNESERELRRVAVGRKAWLFVGSDDHAQAAGNILSLIASARLHGFDPELYLRAVLVVLAQWPRDRYLELAPKYWAATRARLDPEELDREIAWITIPPPLPTDSSQEPSSR